MALAGCGTAGIQTGGQGGESQQGGQVDQLAIGATEQSSSAYPFYVALGNVINGNVTGVNATVKATRAAVANVRMLSKHTLDLGLVTEATAYQAYKGTKGSPFAGKSLKGLRTLFIYDDAPQYYFVTQDSGVTTVKALDGKTWSPGFSGSATEVNTKLLFGALGIHPKYYTGSLDDITTAIKNGRTIGMAKGGSRESLDASTLSIATSRPIRILSFPDAGVSKVEKKYPDITWC